MRRRGREATPLDAHRLEGERVVVLGGAGLIGSAICRVLAASGMHVTAIDRNEEALAALRRRVPEIQGEAADIADGQTVQVVASYRPSHLVHAAGAPRQAGTGRSLSEAEWSDTVGVHLIAPVRLAESVIGALKEEKRRGSVTFITSVHSHVIIGNPSYGAAKAGLEEAMRELARMAAPHRIRVNAVAPGHVSIGPKGSPVSSPPTVLGGESIPPDSIARAVRFLTCGHCSPHTTGSTFLVDAGLSLVAPWIRA